MPLPGVKKNEKEAEYMQRCMTFLADEKRPNDQKVAMCMTTFRNAHKSNSSDSIMSDIDFCYSCDQYLIEYESGFEEELTEENFYIPSQAEYVDFGEASEEWDVAQERPGLWENIRKKKQRLGKKYKPAKPGDKDRPDPSAWKKAQQSQTRYKYKNPKTGELYTFDKRGSYKKDDTVLMYLGEASEEGSMLKSQLKKISMQCMEMFNLISDEAEIAPWVQDNISKADAHIQSAYDYMVYGEPESEDEDEDETEESEASEYQGRKVTLNKPFRTPSGPKKFSVYVKNEKGNVVKVNFGSPDMEIKRDIPARRKSFRARHKCDNPGPKWKAKYWSCQWSWR